MNKTELKYDICIGDGITDNDYYKNANDNYTGCANATTWGKNKY
jgi:hypothetical protein